MQPSLCRGSGTQLHALAARTTCHTAGGIFSNGGPRSPAPLTNELGCQLSRRPPLSLLLRLPRRRRQVGLSQPRQLLRKACPGSAISTC